MPFMPYFRARIACANTEAQGCALARLGRGLCGEERARRAGMYPEGQRSLERSQERFELCAENYMEVGAKR
jgi:hypothetical protein